MQLKHILMAYDFSPQSTLALDEAIELAQKFSARIDLMHVIPYNEVSRLMDLIPHLDAVEEKIRNNVAQEFEKIVGNSQQPITTHIRIGSPAKEIVAFAESAAYDLLILGTHGHRGFKRFFLGSTAEAVIRHARLPVLITRNFSTAAIRHILAPVDFSDTAKRALAHAKQWADTFGATLTVMHALGERYYLPFYIQTDPEAFGGLVGEYEEKEKVELEKWIKTLPWKNSPPELIFKTDVDPAHAIIDAAKDKHCDLIMLGTHGRSGLDHVLLGSVAEKVVRYAECSVMTVPLN